MLTKTKSGQLADVLGDLPLALEQAAAYLDTTRMPLGTYLSLWKTRSEELLARGQVVGHDHTIATVWDLSVERVAREQPGSLGFAKDISIFGTKHHSNFSILFWSKRTTGTAWNAVRDPLSLADVTGALTSYSLCQLLSHETIVALTFHRLVQAAMRRKLSEQEKEAITGTTLRSYARCSFGYCSNSGRLALVVCIYATRIDCGKPWREVPLERGRRGVADQPCSNIF